MTEFEFLVTESDNVVTIDLNRPEEGNALTRPMIASLAETIRTAGARETANLLVLKSRGGFFCRGRDGRGEEAYKTPYERRQKAMGPVLDVYDAIGTIPIPAICLAHAPAIGFGAALAGACDITLAAANAEFAFSEINHGIPPTMAMASVIRNMLPKALAYLIYSAESISAAEAASLGLASKVFPSAEFETKSAEFIAKLAGRGRIVLETIKKFQNHATHARPDTVSEYAGTLLALVRS